MVRDITFTEFEAGILYVFDDRETTNKDTEIRMTPADSAHQIGLTLHWKELLMTLGSICG